MATFSEMPILHCHCWVKADNVTLEQMPAIVLITKRYFIWLQTVLDVTEHVYVRWVLGKQLPCY